MRGMSWLHRTGRNQATPQEDRNTISLRAVLVSVQKRALKEPDHLWREWARSAGYPDPGTWRQPVVRKPFQSGRGRREPQHQFLEKPRPASIQFGVFPVLPLPA